MATGRIVASLTLGGSLCFSAVAARDAEAGGFSTARFGGEHGHAASDSVTSLYYNPAGIAIGTGTRIYIEGTFAYRLVDYDRDPGTIDNPGTATPDDAIDANSGPAELANFIASPFAGVVTDLGMNGFALGLGVYVPFGGQAEWGENDEWDGNLQYPGAVDSPARWATIEGAQRSLYGTLGAGWASPDRSVAFGVGLNVISSNISLVRARNATGTDDLVNPDGTVAEGRSLLELDDLTFGLGLGAQWAPSDKVRFGLSYQSQPGFGDMTLEGTLTNKFGSAGEASDEVVLIQRMPDIVRFGAELQATPELVVRLAADWQRWSAFQNQCLLPVEETNRTCTFNPDGSVDTASGGNAAVIVNLPRDWNDTFGARVGVGYAVSPTIEVAGSVSYDSNAVPDETMDPSLFDMNKVIAQVGGDFAIGDKLFVNATLAHVAYFSRETEPRAVDPMAPSRNPDMAGSYAQSITFALLGVGARL